MGQISQFFGRGKHWQVFAYFVAVNVVAGLAGAMVKQAGGTMGAGLEGMISAAVIFPGLGLWAWSVGKTLHGAAPAQIRLPLGWFQLTVIFSGAYFPLFGSSYDGFGPKYFLLIFPFYLFAVYSLFYQVYFVAKSLVLAEKGAPTRFIEYALEYVLTLAFPLGVWVLQGRVNRLCATAGRAEHLVLSSN